MADPVADPAATSTPTAADVIKAADSMSEKSLDALLADSMTPAPVMEPAAAVAPVVDPAKPAEATPEPAQGEEEITSNWRLHIDPKTPEGKKEAAFYALRKSGKTVEEAYSVIYGAKAQESAKPETQVTPPAPVDPGAEYDTKITAAQAELSVLETALTKAIDEGDTKASMDRVKEIGRKEREIEKLTDGKTSAIAQAQSTVAETQEQTFRQKAGEASRQAITEYPQFAVKPGEVKSSDRKALEDFIASKRDDPDYESVFLSPRWPVILVREYASVRGMKPAAGSPPPPSSSSAKPVQRAPAAEVITSAPGTQAFTATRENFLKNVDNMSPKELDALLASPKRG